MWKLPLFEIRTTSPSQVDVTIIGVFQDLNQKPILPKEPYSSLVANLVKKGSFSARQNEIQFIQVSKQNQMEGLLLIGLGDLKNLTEERLRMAGGHAWNRLVAEKVSLAQVDVDSFQGDKANTPNLEISRCTKAFAEGLILGAYRFEKYKSKSEKSKGSGAAAASPVPQKLIFLTQNKGLKVQVETALKRVHSSAEAIRVTRDWSNEPSNHGTPSYYAQEAKKLAMEHHLKCKVLTETDAAREKMGLFLAVGQGSEKEGRVVVVEYEPKKKTRETKTVVLVGKGITFDSGGISIKPSARMEEMKHDMTGAATVMGAVLLASKWEISNRVVGIMAFTENMPDGNAIQPGNIVAGRSGKTVEIINTDAEGRLILADVLDFAHQFKPDALIDVATLTGAVGVALGKQCCAVFGTDNQLIDSVIRAGEVHGERIWQLPLYDEYFEDLKSDVADMKNSANDAYGGAIRGAIFLKQFIKKGISWAHLDIAGTAYNLSHLPYLPKRGASGAHVRTLAQFAADF